MWVCGCGTVQILSASLASSPHPSVFISTFTFFLFSLLHVKLSTFTLHLLCRTYLFHGYSNQLTSVKYDAWLYYKIRNLTRKWTNERCFASSLTWRDKLLFFLFDLFLIVSLRLFIGHSSHSFPIIIRGNNEHNSGLIHYWAKLHPPLLIFITDL